MFEIEYELCVYTIIYTNGASQTIRINLQKKDDLEYRKEKFRKILENQLNVREVRV